MRIIESLTAIIYHFRVDDFVSGFSDFLSSSLFISELKGAFCYISPPHSARLSLVAPPTRLHAKLC